jgi:hypothetical protein
MHLATKISAVVSAVVLCAAVAAAQDVSVTVNGQPTSLNPPPVERAGRVFVPLRGVFERLGASVVYANGQINAQGNGRSISLNIGSTQATVNGQSQTLDVAPFIIGASTYVPLRFIAQSLGSQVNWDNNNRIVAIVGGGGPGPGPGRMPNEVNPPQSAESSLTLRREQPENGSIVPSMRPRIEATFANGAAEPGSIRVRLDGIDITDQATRSPNGVAFTPDSNLVPRPHRVEILGRDTSGEPFRLAWTFRTESP